MGDHRANIKTEFTIHGKTYKHEWDWINYFDDGTGIDYRVTEWFRDCWGDAQARYDKQVAEYFREQNAKETEAAEREQLAALKAKYDSA